MLEKIYTVTELDSNEALYCNCFGKNAKVISKSILLYNLPSGDHYNDYGLPNSITIVLDSNSNSFNIGDKYKLTLEKIED